MTDIATTRQTRPRGAELVKIKNSKNQVESVYFGSFAFHNQHFAQTIVAPMCVPLSLAFRNSVLVFLQHL